MRNGKLWKIMENIFLPSAFCLLPSAFAFCLFRLPLRPVISALPAFCVLRPPAVCSCHLPSCSLRSKEHFQDAFPAGAFHCMHAPGKRIFFTNQAVNIDRPFIQEIERRLESAATGTHNTVLVNYQTGLIDFIDLARSLKGRL